MRLLPPRESSRLAVVGLVAANAVPLVGVALLGWQLSVVMVIYWLESGVIGALNVPKVLLAAGSEVPENFNATINGRQVDLSGPTEPRDGLHLYPENTPIAGFFVMHYGIFWVVHGVFVFTLFAPSPFSNAFGLSTVLLGLGGMVVSHAGSFLVNFVGNEEYRATSPGLQMKEPYRRVIVLHVTIVLGAFVVTAVGAPVAALLLLVGLKTATDLHAHLKEHRRAAERRRERVKTGERDRRAESIEVG
ncbi:hypothetical protein C2R22_01585 [Salinigranum rubrum]|uniref:Uncharacterized protein n=1 Tax=Salinigranum rubrum TaxID=755307 RepID=A0A2I8VF03_9EURY|nr:DUF6498-containing protein [Salinigranum rubrum]AUV80508.1 hypothetical protein C2R22_01585 [Salinigranum rubrum]